MVAWTWVNSSLVRGVVWWDWVLILLWSSETELKCSWVMFPLVSKRSKRYISCYTCTESCWSVMERHPLYVIVDSCFCILPSTLDQKKMLQQNKILFWLRSLEIKYWYFIPLYIQQNTSSVNLNQPATLYLCWSFHPEGVLKSPSALDLVLTQHNTASVFGLINFHNCTWKKAMLSES